jgi:2-polyprenyl-3-methyl-5-hydroxy-6-metoxy-1,4-benzoquinol methylase
MQQKQYYDAEWTKWHARERNDDELARMHFIIENLRKHGKPNRQHKLKIIDLGCGPGWITNELSKYGDVTGVDLSTGVAQTNYPLLNFVKKNIITDTIEGKYDVVVSSEVIEHLTSEDQTIYVKKAYELLDKEGILILTTPNAPEVAKLVKESLITSDHLQPIENWLDNKFLKSLLGAYFKIEFMGSIVFAPVSVRKFFAEDNRYIKFTHKIISTIRRYKLYSFINRFVGRLSSSSMHGLYLTAVARKLKSINYP